MSSSRISSISGGSFLILKDYNAAVLAERMAAKPGLTVDDRHFEEQNPAHPLAASNRFARIKAADRIMNLTHLYGKPLPADILEILHRSLFDCSAAVRHSIAGALFMAGDESSIEYLTKLLEQEQDSPAVRIRAQAALERMSSPFSLPENVPQIVVVLDNLLLVEELMEMARREGAALRHARPDSPDIIAFSGHVKIIDRQLLGKNAWEDFCDYLAEVNNDKTDYPTLDEIGELVIETHIRDDTPLIIVDIQPVDDKSVEWRKEQIKNICAVNLKKISGSHTTNNRESCITPKISRNSSELLLLLPFTRQIILIIRILMDYCNTIRLKRADYPLVHDLGSS
jgi:hypothetical protein